jgi:predicted secreted hydrolase
MRLLATLAKIFASRSTKTLRQDLIEMRYISLIFIAALLMLIACDRTLPEAPLAQAAVFASAPDDGSFLQVIGPRGWSFPRDHGRHDGFRTEWWYFTGNVRTAAGRRFGYQLTFFRTAMDAQPATRPSPWGLNDIYFAHAAISDLAGNRFIFKDRLERGREGLAESSDQTMDVKLLDWSAKFEDAPTQPNISATPQSEQNVAQRNNNIIHLIASENDFAIDLKCAPGRGPVLQGPGGVNAKGNQIGQASYYYSQTRLPTAGSLTIAGEKFDITGITWMDHEFSSDALSSQQSGWDWMGLSLDNGDDLMIYRLRNLAGQTDYLSGTRVTSDGEPHYLTASQIQMRGSSPWTSPVTGGAYPQRWQLQIEGMPAMVVQSAMPNQELQTTNSTKISYFEGAADVLDSQGHPIGQGYLEMTGYDHSIGHSF